MDYSEVYEVIKKELKTVISSYKINESDVNYDIFEYKDTAGNMNISLHVKCAFESTEENMFHVTLINNLDKYYQVRGNVKCKNPFEFNIDVILTNGELPKG